MKSHQTQDKEKIKPVYGIGINDSGYVVSRYETVDGKQKGVWICPFYRAWKHMLERCYSKRLHKIRSSYVGCEVCLEWQRFSVFRRWMKSQDWQGKQLDKDILVLGNKVYSPAACIFVSRQLNNFLTNSLRARGDFQIGVSWNNRTGKFISHCKNPFAGKLEGLGYFSTEDAAHEAWRRRKHELAYQHASLQKDARLADALRSRFAIDDSVRAA